MQDSLQLLLGFPQHAAWSQHACWQGWLTFWAKTFHVFYSADLFMCL